jgi:hypothetical protein
MPLLTADEPPPQTPLPADLVGRLGRLKDPQDPRDYQIRALLRAAPHRIARQNARAWLPPRLSRRLDQGRTSSCVEHAITHAIYGHPQPRNVAVPWRQFELYRRAQQIDEWPGAEPRYYGTSVRAGLQAATEMWPGKDGGLVSGPVESYYRVEDYDDALDLLSSDDYGLGCSLVVGTDWSGSMFQVDAKGVIEFDPGDNAGGHAWWLRYINQSKGLCGGLNSWGTDAQQSGMLPGGGFFLPLKQNGLRDLWDRGADAWVLVQRGSALSSLAERALTL